MLKQVNAGGHRNIKGSVWEDRYNQEAGSRHVDLPPDYTSLPKPALLHSYDLPHTPVFTNRTSIQWRKGMHLIMFPSVYPVSQARKSSEPMIRCIPFL
jgi:hypothetical protein